jgi:hypothetical protein
MMRLFSFVISLKSNPRGAPKLGDGWSEAAVKSFI